MLFPVPIVNIVSLPLQLFPHQIVLQSLNFFFFFIGGSWFYQSLSPLIIHCPINQYFFSQFYNVALYTSDAAERIYIYIYIYLYIKLFFLSQLPINVNFTDAISFSNIYVKNNYYRQAEIIPNFINITIIINHLKIMTFTNK